MLRDQTLMTESVVDEVVLLLQVTLTVTIFAKWTFGSHPEVQTEEEWQNQFGGLYVYIYITFCRNQSS